MLDCVLFMKEGGVDIHSKKGILFLVQVDHLSGEWLGQAMDVFYKAGASNVQIVPTMTKKNRPSYMIYIDCKTEYSDAIEALIPVEFNTGGWHRIETKHRYLHNQKVQRPLRICSENVRFDYMVVGKRFENGNVRPEHDNVLELKKKIMKVFSIYKSYGEVYQMAMTILINNGDGSRITI